MGLIRHDHAGGAEAALQRVMLAKRRQQRRRRITGLAQALKGVHGFAVRLDGKDRARFHRSAVQVDRARAALSGVASDMDTGDAEFLSEEVDEPRPCLDLGVPLVAVDRHDDTMT
jgi:hypothetical protein